MRRITITRPQLTSRAPDYAQPVDHKGRTVYPARADGTHFCIPITPGQPSVRVKSLGLFARALVRRRIGHDNFVIRVV